MLAQERTDAMLLKADRTSIAAITTILMLSVGFVVFYLANTYLTIPSAHVECYSGGVAIIDEDATDFEYGFTTHKYTSPEGTTRRVPVSSCVATYGGEEE